MSARVLILGAGFGGLELSTELSLALGGKVDVTLIDRNEAFMFGFSKLDLMFGHATLDDVRMPYRNLVKPGVRFVQQTITAIDPTHRRVTTDAGVYDADYLVVALGAELDIAATPGLTEGNEFYTVVGAARLRDALPKFVKGHAVIGACGAPYKCPPAPSEAALLLDDYLTARGVREECDITLVLPFASPVPPSPDTSAALMNAFTERRIMYMPDRRVTALDMSRKVVVLDDGGTVPCDLFLGVPKHCVPAVVEASGLAENGWIPVNPRTLETKFSAVYAIGDVASTGAAKSGTLAEGAARSVASSLIALIGGIGQPQAFGGTGTCYIEFGRGRVGRVDVDFFSGPKPSGVFHEASVEQRADKNDFGVSRRARWFGTAGTSGEP